MSCRFRRIDSSIWASAYASSRFASLRENPSSRNMFPPALVRWRDFVSTVISILSLPQLPIPARAVASALLAAILSAEAGVRVLKSGAMQGRDEP